MLPLIPAGKLRAHHDLPQSADRRHGLDAVRPCAAANTPEPQWDGFRQNVESGGLLSYGVDIQDQIGRAAVYVDRVLKGARPADLPVEQASKFELALNRKTAAALGVALPQSLLLRVDRLVD